MNIGIFAASIATLRPLFRATFQGASYGTDYHKQSKGVDKQGFVRHVSNSKGEGNVESVGQKDEEFEMFGNVRTTTVGGKGREEAEESDGSVLPLQNPGILKTTSVDVSVNEKFKGGHYEER